MANTSTREGYDHELAFWRGFVKDPRFVNGWLSKERTPDLRPWMHEWFQRSVTAHTKVLDVGSGVVSILNGTVPNDNLKAADPLARHYAEIFDYDSHDVVRPEPYQAEHLPDDWNEAFHVVHMSNALDHTENPIRALQALLRVTRPGGFVVIEGFVNEGAYEKWEGLHQWNVSIAAGGHLAIGNRLGGEMTVAAAKYGARNVYGMTEVLETGKKWLIWIVQKSS